MRGREDFEVDPRRENRVVLSTPLSETERRNFHSSELQRALELVRVMETVVEACRMTITEDVYHIGGGSAGQFQPAVRPIAKEHAGMVRDFFRVIKKHCPRISLGVVEPYWCSPNVAVSALWT